MKRVLVIIIFIAFQIAAIAQTFVKSPKVWYLEGLKFLYEEEYGQAITCLENALEGFHNEGNVDYEIKVMCYLGEAKSSIYDLMGALAYYQKADKLAISFNNDQLMMPILKEQMLLCETLGDYDQIQVITSRIDSLFSLSDVDDVKMEYYFLKGDEAKKQEKYKLSEYWYRKNEHFINKLDDSYHAERYHFYHKLSDLYTTSCEWSDALRYTQLANKEIKRFYKEDNGDNYLSYLNMSYIYREIGDVESSLRCLDTAYNQINRYGDIKEKARWYVVRAGLYSAINNYKGALTDYKMADELLSGKYNNNDDKIMLLSLMGGMEYHLGNYLESERLYFDYAKKIKQLQGENNLDYINALIYLANAEGYANHIDLACRDFADAVDKLKELTQSRLPYYTTVERESYWKSVSDVLLKMVPFALKSEQYQTDFTKSCYDALVLMKAFLLSTETSTCNLIKRYGTSDDLDVFANIASMRAKLLDLKIDYDINIDNIAKLNSEIRKMESSLAGKCRVLGDITDFMSVDYNKIKHNLNKGDVLIDFTDFVTKDNDRVYAAFLLNNKQKNPLLTKLFAESEIDSMQVAYPDMYYENPYAENMRQLLWEPFKDYVKDGATVYYVPSQFLFQIAFENIPLEDGTLLGEKYHFVRLTSARDVIGYEARIDIDVDSNKADVVLYGGLQYKSTQNLSFHDEIMFDESVFRELPNSVVEIETIRDLMKSHHIKTISYTNDKGTKDSFLDLKCNSFKILHIATHGFYYTQDEAMNVECLKGYKEAMSLSGLVMSDGLITAADISRLDLSGVDLVVLSACHSGKGKATLEGLYGLQRAFKKAGVKTIIMSLWSESDVVGAKIMEAFYDNLLDDKINWNKRKAFEKTIYAIRQQYTEPYYWAGYVMLD